MIGRPKSASSETEAGVLYAVLAYGLWGFSALFFKLLDRISALEIVAHRAFWSIPLALAALLAMRKLWEVADVLRSPALLGRLAISAALVGTNWGFFVWAVAVDRTLETSLGYYINPLLNIVVGYFAFGERFTAAQTLAIGLAVLAVVLVTLEAGVLPWLALLLAGTFAAYAYVRKTVPIGPVQGFLVESVLLAGPGIAIVAWLSVHGESRFLEDWKSTLLLIGCGPMTALPLMWFAAAARRLRFSTLGILQYIAPTGLFLTAVFAFGEPATGYKLVAFALIWTALAIYTFEARRSEGGQ
jgi:chloramphenicol-sensitive protein RarD